MTIASTSAGNDKSAAPKSLEMTRSAHPDRNPASAPSAAADGQPGTPTCSDPHLRGHPDRR